MQINAIEHYLVGFGEEKGITKQAEIGGLVVTWGDGSKNASMASLALSLNEALKCHTHVLVWKQCQCKTKASVGYFK